MAFPRTCALAEVAWSPKGGKDWGEFEGRLKVHMERLDAFKVNYRRADGTPAATGRMGRGG
jgi:hexosaminidase